MKIVIAGCGRVGSMLADRFSADGHDVSVIDKDQNAFRRLGRGFKGEKIRGLVFDKQVLDKAGADRAEAFVAVTSGDNSNVVSATIARDIYRIPRVVARIFDPRRAEIYRRFGIPTISSVSWATNEVVSLVLHSHVIRDMQFGDGEVQLVSVRTPALLVGKTIENVVTAGEMIIVAMVRGGKSFIPVAGTVFEDGDILEFAVQTSALPKFKRIIGL